ncbi:hypothetical protein EJ06DRAFT_35513 [Trichodelitschia bisporula]|uniref:F-box domain-containing protein n=1 Tax=Trichodelitschia bisporula TaxID=703511 RepID=A0A6G1HV72_9PEZI|nr:hypothetical protein EJ06DRAFT_35513 [Trichodelitschia bisporula]
MAASSQTSDRHVPFFIVRTKPSTIGITPPSPLTYLSSTEPLAPFQHREFYVGEHFSTLPVSIFFIILSFLPEGSVPALRLTCHATHSLIQPMFRLQRLCYLASIGDPVVTYGLIEFLCEPKPPIVQRYLVRGVTEIFSSIRVLSENFSLGQRSFEFISDAEMERDVSSLYGNSSGYLRSARSASHLPNLLVGCTATFQPYRPDSRINA